MTLNHKDLRIRKCYERGINDPERIARKIGLNGESGVERVVEGLTRMNLFPPTT